MSTPEQSFWKTVRDAWKGHAVRIEASVGGCDPGTPDVSLAINGKGGWVETKVWPQLLEPSQLPWHMHAMRSGAYAVVLAQLPDGKVWLGTAEDYDRATSLWYACARGDRTLPQGVSLQQALNVVACALSGKANRRRS